MVSLHPQYHQADIAVTNAFLAACILVADCIDSPEQAHIDKVLPSEINFT